MTRLYYKAFNRKLQCRGFQFEERGVYEVEDEPILCKHGFHFCKELVLTLKYYSVNDCITENKYAEVEVLGNVKWEDPTGHKGCTNKIRIVRVLSDEEVLKLVEQ